MDSEEEAVRDVIEVLKGGALPSLEALGLNWTAMGSQVSHKSPVFETHSKP